MTAGALNLTEHIRQTRRRRRMPWHQQVARATFFFLLVVLSLTYPWVILAGALLIDTIRQGFIVRRF